MAPMSLLSSGWLLPLQLLLLPWENRAWLGGAGSHCKDPASCQTHVKNLIEGLDAQRQNMTGKHLVIDALEHLRTGLTSGDRIPLSTTHRQHLEKGSPLVGDISYDAKHRPLSTNLTRHLKLMRTIADEVDIRIHTILPLKKPSGQKIGPSALLISIDTLNRMSIHTLEGDMRLRNFDLGHGEGRTITQVVMSPNQDNHFVVTVDDQGDIRVHTLKVIAKRAEEKTEDVCYANGTCVDDEDKPELKPEEKFEQKHGIKRLTVTANFSTEFRLPPSSKTGETRILNTVLPIDRGNQMLFVTGDSAGGIGVFHRNGTLKGRVKVTEDPGGVKGLMRGQGQTVLFFSSHSFGFLSVSQVDVQYPPCTGWNSPLFDIAPDPSLSYSRVILALSDGDVLVFSTTRGKSKACDLTLKFPHVSSLPFKLQVHRGHVIGLPTPLESTPRKDEYLRELHFFNLAEMDAGYGTAPTRVVTFQANFNPRRPNQFAIYSGGAGGGADRGKVQLTLHFVGEKGLSLYELNLKQPPAPKSQQAEGGGWLDWFPKVGVFGIAMVGVVIWNVKKMSGGSGGGGGGGLDDFDAEEMLKGAGLGKGGLAGLGKKGLGGGKGAGLGGLGGLAGGLGGGFDDD